jgi:hypothetical protein
LNTHNRLWSFVFALQLLGGAGHSFFYWVQENFYGTENFLKPINDALNNQTSATTYFVVLSMTASWVLLYLFFAKKDDFLDSTPGRVGVYLWTLIPLAVYEAYEYYQMLHPTYYDDHIMDMVLAFLAVLTLWIVIWLRMRR